MLTIDIVNLLTDIMADVQLFAMYFLSSCTDCWHCDSEVPTLWV